jgi:predicted regulator of Ras-like GTPase activity (Roadblock/LC7/MglB family)
LTRDGALLAYSGFEAKDAKIIAAMASSIFAAHQRVRQTPGTVLPQNIVGSGDLNMILLDAEVSFNTFTYIRLICFFFLFRKEKWLLLL